MVIIYIQFFIVIITALFQGTYFYCNNYCFEANDSDNKFIERRFDAESCIIFKLQLHELHILR